MNAKDIRIGNYIYQANEIIPVNWETIREIATQPEDALAYRPILLGTDWLKRLGFKKSNASKDGEEIWFLPDEISSQEVWVELDVSTIITIGKETVPLPVDIGYVHELQNAYHAMTGEELVIRSN